jgi:two-component system nitrate/nitrite response regulator NarL
MSPPIRVLLIDDHHLMRTGLRQIIESRARFRVAAEVVVGEQALNVVGQLQPELVLIDGDDEGALDLLPELRKTSEQSRLLVLLNREELGAYQQVVQSGAHGVLLKSVSPEEMLIAFDKVYSGEMWFSRVMLAKVLWLLLQPKQAPMPEEQWIARLTEREREIITLVGEGLKNYEIAERLSLSHSTVRHHLTSIYSKLDVADRLELLIFAYRHGLAEQP